MKQTAGSMPVSASCSKGREGGKEERELNFYFMELLLFKYIHKIKELKNLPQ